MEGAAAKPAEQKKVGVSVAPITSYVALACKKCSSFMIHLNVAQPIPSVCEKCKIDLEWVGWLAVRPGVDLHYEAEKPKPSEAPQATAAAAPSA